VSRGLLLFLIACQSPEPAPEDLDSLTAHLFSNFEAEDEVLQLAMNNLRARILELDLTADLEDRSFSLTSLQSTDLEGLDRPDRELSDLTTFSLAYDSPFPVDVHVPSLLLDDLTPLSLTATTYDRIIHEPEDPCCFQVQECPVMRSENHIIREQLLYTLDYQQLKDYRWVELSDGEMALVSRGWLPESAHGAAGSNHIYQSFDMEAWIPSGDHTLRYFALYTEFDYAGVSTEAARSISLSATEAALANVDEYLAAQ
jgi:hypothetical protein